MLLFLSLGNEASDRIHYLCVLFAWAIVSQMHINFIFIIFSSDPSGFYLTLFNPELSKFIWAWNPFNNTAIKTFFPFFLLSVFWVFCSEQPLSEKKETNVWEWNSERYTNAAVYLWAVCEILTFLRTFFPYTRYNQNLISDPVYCLELHFSKHMLYTISSQRC